MSENRFALEELVLLAQQWRLRDEIVDLQGAGHNADAEWRQLQANARKLQVLRQLQSN